jgi:FkbM family methyltransferase
MFGRAAFINKIIFKTLASGFKHPDNNFDYVRFGNKKPADVPAKESLMTLLSVVKNNGRFYDTYQMLADEYSKDIYISLLIFRILGPGHVKLPVNNTQYWDKYKSVDTAYRKEQNTFSVGNFSLNKYEIANNRHNIKLNGHPLSFLNTYLLGQYRYNHDNTIISAEEGDNVIEAGACWGDTSLYFSSLVGSRGKVYAFEFEKRNLEVLNENLRLNPELAPGVQVVKNAVWSSSGEVFNFTQGGPGTTITKDSRNEGSKVVSVSIDDFVKERGLSSVGFIKMDIEGAEMNALKGAEQTIRAYKPKLAISLYHRFRDFYEIPGYLKELNEKYNLNYKFYLDHFTIYSEETVLFAKAA